MGEALFAGRIGGRPGIPGPLSRVRSLGVRRLRCNAFLGDAGCRFLCLKADGLGSLPLFLRRRTFRSAFLGTGLFLIGDLRSILLAAFGVLFFVFECCIFLPFLSKLRGWRTGG